MVTKVQRLDIRTPADVESEFRKAEECGALVQRERCCQLAQEAC
jgi:hypothetical protein